RRTVFLYLKHFRHVYGEIDRSAFGREGAVPFAFSRFAFVIFSFRSSFPKYRAELHFFRPPPFSFWSCFFDPATGRLLPLTLCNFSRWPLFRLFSACLLADLAETVGVEPREPQPLGL